jgi:hypothetical protein
MMKLGHPVNQIDFRAGEGDFSYLLNLFLLEPEPAEKILKEKYSKKTNMGRGGIEQPIFAL